MNIIEQRIRMYVQKLLISEAGGNESGYDIKIPGTMLIGDPEDGLKRWRVERINQQAIAAGCQRGFLIVATRRPKFPTNDSALMNDIVNTIKTIDTYKNFYGDDYRIILSNPVERGKRKIYAAWLIDLRTAPPENRFARLLKTLQDIQRQSVYQQYARFEKYAIGSTDVIDQSQAIAWTTAIKKYLLYIKNAIPAGYSRYFPEDPNEFIPDFSQMNRIKIPDEVDTDINIAPKLTLIDDEWYYLNAGFHRLFIGSAIISTDPISGILTLQPVTGTLDIKEHNTNRKGTFTGTFKDGAPSVGITKWQAAAGGEAYVDNEKTKFDGTNKATTLITINPEDNNPVSDLNYNPINGKLYYNKKKDPEAVYFDGSFSHGKMPSNGIVYERDLDNADTKLRNYTAIGQIINSKYLDLPKSVTYPYTPRDGGGTVYQLTDNTDYVYAWVADKNAWLQVKTSIHVKLINGSITEEGFNKYINYITDPTTIAKLSAEFKQGTNYVILKANTPIDVYNKAGKKNTYDPSKDARGTKLEWTGKKGNNNNTDWYEVLMKRSTGEFIPDGYWIRASDVKSEEINYPFK